MVTPVNVILSVVVLNWNGRRHLEVCLAALQRQTLRDFEIILVDNGSSDTSVAYVERRFPGVKIIPLRRNRGFCTGNNIGIRHTRGRFVVLLNNDTEAKPDWLEQLIEAAERHPQAGLFASKMLLYDDRKVIDTAGDEFHVAGFASKRGWLQRDGAAYGIEAPVFGACAGAVMYRRSMLEKIDLLDDDFFANGEDVDISFRALLNGYGCIYVPDAVVFHKGGATIGRDDRWFYMMRRNQLWIMMKNMPMALLIKYGPLILFYNAMSLFYHGLRGRAALIGRAYGDALKGMPAMLRKRTVIQSGRSASIKQIESMLQKRGLLQRALNPMTRQLTQRYHIR